MKRAYIPASISGVARYIFIGATSIFNKRCKEVEWSTKGFWDYLAGRHLHAVSSSDMTKFGPILNASKTLNSPGWNTFWLTAPINAFMTAWCAGTGSFWKFKGLYNAPRQAACQYIKVLTVHPAWMKGLNLEANTEWESGKCYHMQKYLKLFILLWVTST